MLRDEKWDQKLIVIRNNDVDELWNGNVKLGEITWTDVSGKKSLDVNVTSIPINYTDDSMQVKGPNGNSISPSTSGAVGSYLDGMLEKIIMKAIGRLSFNSINQLRAEVQLINIPSQVSAGNVSCLTGALAINGSSQVATQQSFQQSFRRNLNVV